MMYTMYIKCKIDLYIYYRKYNINILTIRAYICHQQNLSIKMSRGICCGNQNTCFRCDDDKKCIRERIPG